MSDDETDPREILLRAHRREKKELQAKIQALKKAASKGDKKKKKDVVDTVEQLEKDLVDKHRRELEQFESSAAEGGGETSVPVSEVSAEVEDGSRDVEEEDKPLGPLPVKDGNFDRVSKAQKRRDKKVGKEKERLEEIERQELINRDGPRNKEHQAIKEKLKNKQLKLKEIPSDGDCMFSGILHQLQLLDINSSVRDLRIQTAEELQSNPDEYSPFLSNPSTGDMLSTGEYKEYCDKMGSTPAWGGQVELKALSTVLKKPIQVIQGEGPDILVGEEFRDTPLILTYHRHLHGLGEHYNSVTTRVGEDEATT